MSSYVLDLSGVCFHVRHNVGVAGDAVAGPGVTDGAWKELVEGVDFGCTFFLCDKSEGYGLTAVGVLVVGRRDLFLVVGRGFRFLFGAVLTDVSLFVA